MKLSIHWDNIKDGFRGFEKLAYKYVFMNYPNPNWKKTPDTRDGNKDATAVFFGFQSQEDGEEQWWMEAKYSSSKQIITRYRLDSTIVSAILEKNIKKIIFVTNISINAKTIIDIRHALCHAISCDEVIFCTKFTLEYWLALNKDIYKEYFNISPILENFEIEMPHTFVIQQIEYYSEVSNKFSFKESLRELFKGEIYTGYFKIFSPNNQVMSIFPNKYICGLTILSDPSFSIIAGENPISFSFKIEENYQYIQNGRNLPPSFLLGDTEILSERDIIPSRRTYKFLEMSFQRNLINNLSADYESFVNDTAFNLQFIEGISGSGKSYILDCILKRISIGKEDVFYAAFSGSSRNNSEILINILIFIMFPYLEPSTVDYLYLKNINNNYISPRILSLIEKKNDIDELSKEIERLLFGDRLFTAKMHINRRIIILDDLQKLFPWEIHFLAILLLDMQQLNMPIYFIGAAQPAFFKNKKFLLIQQYCIAKHHIININIYDILNAISSENKDRFYLNQEFAFLLEFNIIEILIFSKFILDNELYSNDIDDFVFACKIFQRSKIMEKHIVNQFNNFFDLHPNCRTICNQIYWAHSPNITNETFNKNKISLLLLNGLIKYNHESLLVPFHDIYTSYYRAHFKPNVNKALIFQVGSPESLQHNLNYEVERSKLNDAALEVCRLLEENKFYSVIYILQDLFEQTSHNLLQKKFDNVTYYRLYHAYALAAKHQSTGKTGFQIFTDLYNEISEVNTGDILPIILETLWELAISHYERLEYNEVDCKIKKMYSIIRKMQKSERRLGNISEVLKFHDGLMLDTLVRANKNAPFTHELYIRRLNLMQKKGFIYRSESFRIRYALTLSVSDIQGCLEILKQCRQYFKNNYGCKDKYYLWSSFHYFYYTMILENSPELIDKVVGFHRDMKKQYYANYRNRINGMAAYYYSVGKTTDGNRYLMMETVFESDLQARQRAFRYETVALHEMLLGKYSEAIVSLKKSADLFYEFQEYKKIPLHNITVLEKMSTIPPKIEYWWGGKLKEEYFYIDSRCTW